MFCVQLRPFSFIHSCGPDGKAQMAAYPSCQLVVTFKMNIVMKMIPKKKEMTFMLRATMPYDLASW